MLAALACLSLTLTEASAPRAVAADFLRLYLKQGVDLGHLEVVHRLAPFLSKRLLRVVEDAAACQEDWGRQQPPDSTAKPPFVDCCLFASSPEGIPTSFRLGRAIAMPDGRTKVFVEYTYADPPGTYSDPTIPLEISHWRDALVLSKEGGGYQIDDFLFLRDPSQGSLLSASFQECQGRRWRERH